MVKVPMTSSWGNKYVLIIYVYYASTITVEPLKIRSGSYILEAYTKQIEHLTKRGYIPRVHFLDS